MLRTDEKSLRPKRRGIRRGRRRRRKTSTTAYSSGLQNNPATQDQDLPIIVFLFVHSTKARFANAAERATCSGRAGLGLIPPSHCRGNQETPCVEAAQGYKLANQARPAEDHHPKWARDRGLRR